MYNPHLGRPPLSHKESQRLSEKLQAESWKKALLEDLGRTSDIEASDSSSIPLQG